MNKLYLFLSLVWAFCSTEHTFSEDVSFCSCDGLASNGIPEITRS